jgi:copper chaperone CopZ
MHTHIFRAITVSTLALLLLQGCASSQRQEPSPGQVSSASDTQPITAPRATLIVHGMSCPLCASNVDKQLLEVPGVTLASVNMGSGEVTVTFAPKARVTRKQLEDAVYKSGFTLAEVRIP